MELQEKCNATVSDLNETFAAQSQNITDKINEANKKMRVVEEAVSGASQAITSEIEEYCSKKLVHVVPTGEMNQVCCDFG